MNEPFAALVGALVVAIGTVGASVYQTYSHNSKDKDRRIRGRLEELYKLCDRVKEIVEETHDSLHGVSHNERAVKKTAHQELEQMRMLIRLYFDRSLGPHFKALEKANGQWLTTVAFCFENYDEVDVDSLSRDLTDSEETARNRIRRAVKRLQQAIEGLISE